MKKGIVIFMSAVIVLAVCLKVREITSDTVRHTRKFIIQLETNQRNEGTFSSLIPFEYDTVVVFGSTMKKEDMMLLLGFEDAQLKESEAGMHNIVFVKDDQIIAYLYGYHSFQLNLPEGKYDKSQIETMAYVQHQYVYTMY